MRRAPWLAASGEQAAVAHQILPSYSYLRSNKMNRRATARWGPLYLPLWLSVCVCNQDQPAPQGGVFPFCPWTSPGHSLNGAITSQILITRGTKLFRCWLSSYSRPAGKNKEEQDSEFQTYWQPRCRGDWCQLQLLVLLSYVLTQLSKSCRVHLSWFGD